MARRPIINKDETHTAAKPVNTDGDDRTEFEADAVALLPESGIIEGYSDETSHGTYGPNDSLTREQLGKMTDLAYDLDDADSDSSFPDSDESTSWFEDDTISGPAAEAALGGPSKGALSKALSGSKGDDRSDLVSDLPYTDPNETTLDDTLGHALDASSKQGEATASKGADVKTELGGEQLAGLTEIDEADFKNNDTEEA